MNTRHALIRSAAQAFDQHGYTRAKLSAISAGAGVSSGALHFHFDTKAAMAAAVETEATRTLHAITRNIQRKSVSPADAHRHHTRHRRAAPLGRGHPRGLPPQLPPFAHRPRLRPPPRPARPVAHLRHLHAHPGRPAAHDPSLAHPAPAHDHHRRRHGRLRGPRPPEPPVALPHHGHHPLADAPPHPRHALPPPAASPRRDPHPDPPVRPRGSDDGSTRSSSPGRLPGRSAGARARAQLTPAGHPGNGPAAPVRPDGAAQADPVRTRRPAPAPRALSASRRLPRPHSAPHPRGQGTAGSRPARCARRTGRRGLPRRPARPRPDTRPREAGARRAAPAPESRAPAPDTDGTGAPYTPIRASPSRVVHLRTSGDASS
ncbi:TetR family transcriptional regulator [Streptomyces stramineus]